MGNLNLAVSATLVVLGAVALATVAVALTAVAVAVTIVFPLGFGCRALNKGRPAFGGCEGRDLFTLTKTFQGLGDLGRESTLERWEEDVPLIGFVVVKVFGLLDESTTRFGGSATGGEQSVRLSSQMF